MLRPAARALVVLSLAGLLGGCSVFDGLLGGGNVFELAVGDCYDDPEEETLEVTDVEVLACSEPHDNEVFHVFDLPDGEFPGDEVVRATADETCLAAFDTYVGTSYQDSELAYYPLTPTQDSWDSIDDREVLCAAFDATRAKLEGSIQGSQR